MSGLKKVNLVSSHFFSFFYFLFDLFLFFLFLAPGVRISNDMGHLTQKRLWEDDVIPRANLIANLWSFRGG